MMRSEVKTSPTFSLTRLLKTVFAPKGGERVCVLIDLPDPEKVKEYAFLEDPSLPIQHYAHDIIYKSLNNGTGRELNLQGGELFAYKTTGGSNLEIPDECYDTSGTCHAIEERVYTQYDIILCISTYSATAPLTAHARKHGFRGATMHGLNQTIMDTGLSVDYEEVSAQAEKLRLGVTRADEVEIDFLMAGKTYTLKLLLGGQEAQKSHGLCRGPEPDVANLPAGEVYFVPTGAEGEFLQRFMDGTIGIMHVSGGRITHTTLITGSQQVLDVYEARIKADPAAGELGELGLGTQVLPVSGRDIQDEKILGTVHVATGRSDHLGGHLDLSSFKDAGNATHDDILFAPHKTPEINVTQVRMKRGDERRVLIENYQPAEYFRNLLAD